ncbi:MAG: hypothetical protein V6Z89_22270 [Desulfobacter sp.]
MKPIYSLLITLVALFSLAGTGLASDSAHNMAGHDHSSGDSDRIGTLFHESMKQGYMLSYYLMDMRDNHGDHIAGHGSHGGEKMEKPHHIMVYIMDKAHNVVEKAKVGFLIKGGDKGTQKLMAMYMSKGFGITADMKAKGTYTIVAKAVINGTKIMDTFDHEMK